MEFETMKRMVKPPFVCIRCGAELGRDEEDYEACPDLACKCEQGPLSAEDALKRIANLDAELLSNKTTIEAAIAEAKRFKELFSKREVEFAHQSEILSHVQFQLEHARGKIEELRYESVSTAPPKFLGFESSSGTGMLIVRRGAGAPASWRQARKCSACESVVLVEEKHLTRYKHDARSQHDDSFDVVVFTCGACSKLCCIDCSDVPVAVRDRIGTFSIRVPTNVRSIRVQGGD